MKKPKCGKLLACLLTVVFIACHFPDSTDSGQPTEAVEGIVSPTSTLPASTFETEFPDSVTPNPQSNEEELNVSFVEQSVQKDFPVGKNGARCIINTTLKTPVEAKAPVFSAQYVEWTPDDIKRIFTRISDSQSLYAGTFTPDKQYLLEKLDRLEQNPRADEISRGLAEIGQPTLKEQILSWIEALPESVSENPQNWEKYKNVMPAQTALCHFYSESQHSYFNLLFLKNIYGEQDQTLLFSSVSDLIQSEDLVRSGEYVGAKPGRELNNVSLSSEDAIEKAETLLDSLGVRGMLLSSKEKAQRVDVHTGEVLSEGWSLVYHRNICELPCSAAAYQDIYALKGNTYCGVSDEEITLYVDSDGVWTFSWRNPTSVLDKHIQVVSLIDLETLLNRIRELMDETVSHYEENDVTVQKIQITRVFFHYKLLRDPSDNSITARPVWEISFEMDASFAPHPISASFMIDAADGIKVVDE